jgi:uncharacterized SAM-binding protein YcdF (DUF218 family)
MFFVLSKVLGFFASPSNLMIVLGLLGVLLLPTRLTRAGRRLMAASLIALALLGLSPLGNALIIPLEQRFPPWDDSRGPPDGIVVLGGAIAPDVSLARNEVALDEAAERVTAGVALARRYPEARIIYSGGSGALLYNEGSEAVAAVRLLESLGIPSERIIAEEQSRNTVENAVFAAAGDAAAGRALALGDLRLSHAARHGDFPPRRLSGRGLSGRLAHARAAGRGSPVRHHGQRAAARRHRRARVGRPPGLLADRPLGGAVSGAA